MPSMYIYIYMVHQNVIMTVLNVANMCCPMQATNIAKIAFDPPTRIFIQRSVLGSFALLKRFKFSEHKWCWHFEKVGECWQLKHEKGFLVFLFPAFVCKEWTRKEKEGLASKGFLSSSGEEGSMRRTTSSWFPIERSVIGPANNHADWCNSSLMVSFYTLHDWGTQPWNRQI